MSFTKLGDTLETQRQEAEEALVEETFQINILDGADTGAPDSLLKLPLTDNIDSVHRLLLKFEESSFDTQKQILSCIVQQLVNEIRHKQTLTV